jgi:hypothetical protein
MNRRDAIHHHAARSLAALALAVLLPVAPAGAQAPSAGAQAPSAGASVTPAATPARAAIDPRSATGQLLALRDALHADRLLLAELRKDVPTSREEGQAFVGTVVDLALAADPVGLGVIVSRVREAAPAWLDWRSRQYATAQEATDAYVQTGAAAFDASWENLHDAVLLTVVNRLDTIIDLADRIEAGR